MLIGQVDYTFAVEHRKRLQGGTQGSAFIVFEHRNRSIADISNDLSPDATAGAAASEYNLVCFDTLHGQSVQAKTEPKGRALNSGAQKISPYAYCGCPCLKGTQKGFLSPALHHVLLGQLLTPQQPNHL